MARRVVPALLALSALAADVAGGHGYALALALGSIPAGFALTLDCYGELVEGRCSGSRPLLAAAALVLLVFSAALRSPAVVGGVPQLAVSGLVIALLLYSAIAVGGLVQSDRAVPETA
jgi:hypothetical protein